MPWEGYCRAWAEEEGMHEGQRIVRELDARFDQRFLAAGPFFFADLAGVREEDERAAIAAGEIQAGRIDYVGRSRNS